MVMALLSSRCLTSFHTYSDDNCLTMSCARKYVFFSYNYILALHMHRQAGEIQAIFFTFPAYFVSTWRINGSIHYRVNQG